MGTVGHLPIHVGFVCPADPESPGALSGAPHRMMRALGHRVAKLSVCRQVIHRPTSLCGVLDAWRRRVPPRLRPCVRSVLRRTARRPTDLPLETTPEDLLARARESSAALTEWTRRVGPDVLFTPYASAELFAHEASTPILYCSDFTARLLTTTYPDYLAQGKSYARACDQIEATAMQRADAAVFPSVAAHASAVRDYGRDPSRTFVVPFGANVTPSEAHRVSPEPPNRDSIELCIVASEPVRKRLDLAVEITEALRSLGVRAVLNSVGCSTTKSRSSPIVRSLGALRLADPRERACLEATIARSHLLLLPSLGEAFGVTVCEAAHFGRPAIVSDAGGLPTIVQHSVTGLLLPVAAGPEEYARAIAALVREPDRYRAMSAAALARAHTLLNWDAWGTGVAALLRSLCGVAGTSAPASPQACPPQFAPPKN